VRAVARPSSLSSHRLTLIVRECPSSQALVTAAVRRPIVVRTLGMGSWSLHAAPVVYLVCNLLSSRVSAGVLPVGRSMPWAGEGLQVHRLTLPRKKEKPRLLATFRKVVSLPLSALVSCHDVFSRDALVLTLEPTPVGSARMTYRDLCTDL
jgi:hypothetical protein